MINGQLELSIANQPACRRAPRRQRRSRQAHWWFERMREMVDQAVDWTETTPPRVERLQARMGR